jgi:hypothetical protein
MLESCRARRGPNRELLYLLDKRSVELAETMMAIQRLELVVKNRKRGSR